MAEFMEAASSLTFGVWFLVGTAMVFFMQCGFAMVEAGFTRTKNAGNIIMKNLMDFCIGSVVFVTLGSGLMLAEDYIAGFEFSADPTLADIVPAPATPAVPVERLYRWKSNLPLFPKPPARKSPKWKSSAKSPALKPSKPLWMRSALPV